jgi:nicotinamidase-related amidase
MRKGQRERASDGGQGNVALLVIDVQQGLFAQATPVYRAERLLQKINLLLSRARRAGAPVIYARHANKGVLLPGSEGWQLHPAIRPLAKETVIEKRRGDAFAETDLHAVLAAKGVSDLVVAGLVTHGCVNATCVGAMEKGYGVILAADGHSSYSKKAASLIEEWNRKLSEKGATVRRAEQITFGGE